MNVQGSTNSLLCSPSTDYPHHRAHPSRITLIVLPSAAAAANPPTCKRTGALSLCSHRIANRTTHSKWMMMMNGEHRCRKGGTHKHKVCTCLTMYSECTYTCLYVQTTMKTMIPSFMNAHPSCDDGKHARTEKKNAHKQTNKRHMQMYVHILLSILCHAMMVWLLPLLLPLLLCW